MPDVDKRFLFSLRTFFFVQRNAASESQHVNWSPRVFIHRCYRSGEKEASITWLFYSSYRFTQIAVDPQVKTPGGKTYDVLFIGTDNGKVIKAVNAESADSHQKVSPVVIEEIQAFPPAIPVRGIKVVRASQAGDGLEDGRLVVIADSQVQALRLHRCYSDRILSCSECVALQDPYCAWDKVENKCRALVGPAATDANRFLQSVATGMHASCPASKSLNKDASSVGAISANQNKFPQDSIPNKDSPGGEIINIMQDEEQANSGTQLVGRYFSFYRI